MTITNQNLILYRGDTVTVFVALTAADGSPYDPSINADIQYRMARNAHALDGEELVRKSLGSGITLATGGIDVDITAADTDFPPGIYFHSVKIKDVGDVSTGMTGYYVIRRALRSGTWAQPAKIDATLSSDVPTGAMG